MQAEVLAEVPGPHSGHPHRRQRRDLVQAHLHELAGDDRIEVRVVRAGAVPGLQQGYRLVQVVHHGRVVVEEHGVHGPRHRERLLVRVAVDVHVDVAVPVGRGHARQRVEIRLPLEVTVEPVGDLVAAVRLGDRVDEHQHPLAYAADHRLLRDGDPVGELHAHLAAAGLVGVQAAVEVVDRPRRGDDRLGLLGAGAARVGEGGRRPLEPRQIADTGLVRDRDQDDVASLLRPADRLDMHAGGRRRQRPYVRLDRPGVRQLPGGADQVAEPLRGGRDGVRRGHVRHPRAQEARLRREAGDPLHRARLGGVRVGGARGSRRRGGAGEGQGEDRKAKGTIHRAAPLRCLSYQAM